MVLCLVVGLSSLITTNIFASDKTWNKGQILVKPRAGLPMDEFKKILKNNNGKSNKKIGKSNIHIVKVNEHAEEAIIKKLSKNKHIDFAELDILVKLNEFIPNDPKYINQWHLPKIESSIAWENATGNGIIIAILDTGVNPHPDLIDNMVAGYNSADSSFDTNDIFGHGTMTSGTAAASTNNGIGISSIAGNAQIMPIRITNNSETGSAYWSSAVRGIDWATNNGARVVNLSYSMTNSSSVSDASENMRKNGGLVVVSAGNNSSNAGIPDNPHIITVSATNSDDTKASFSTYGDFIDVAAPGVGILTTNRSNGYSAVNGTSFSAPLTAGVVALIMEANPSLNPDNIEKILEDSADGSGSWNQYFGYGRINAAKAVQMALDADDLVDIEPPSINIFSPIDNSDVSDMILIEVNANDNVGIREVSLYVNNILIGSDITYPYQFSWDSNTVPDGISIISAYGDDTSNNQTKSNDISVNVDNTENPIIDNTPPIVEIVNPFDGETVTKVVNIKIDATDNISVSKIELYIDNNLVISIVDVNVLTYSLNTRKISSGVHTITAKAFDSSGNSDTQDISIDVVKSIKGKNRK